MDGIKILKGGQNEDENNYRGFLRYGDCNWMPNTAGDHAALCGSMSHAGRKSVEPGNPNSRTNA